MNSTLLAWGNNQHNLLTVGSASTYQRPQHMSFPYKVVDMSASQKHVAFITPEGTLWTYGINQDGRLGVAAKPDHKIAITTPAVVKLPAAAVKVKCGFSHTWVLLSNGQLWAWGLGDYGALGTGEFKSKSQPAKVAYKGKISYFSCGAMHCGLVDEEGQLFTCGSNEYGELGIARAQKINIPTLVNFGHRANQVQCGVFFTLILTNRGHVFGMGNNKYGQLGIGHKVNQCHPTLIRQIQGAVAIAAGYHSGALDSQGSLYIWGSGSFGELLRPRKIVLQTPLDRISIRGFFGVALSTKYHRVYAWGNNTFGQLGRGNYDPARDPVQIQDLSGTKLSAFTCGVNFFLAISDQVPNYERQTRYTQQVRNTRSKSPLNYERSKNIKRTPQKFQYQYLKRSRHEKNYQELFIALSSDYEALLSRYKIMEDNFQIKNRNIYESQVLRRQNESLRRQNQLLKLQLSQSHMIKYREGDDTIRKYENDDVKKLKEEHMIALRRIVIAEQKAKQFQNVRFKNQELYSQLSKLRTQFKITINQLETLHIDSLQKDKMIQKLQENSASKYIQQIQVLEKKLNEAEEEIAIRGIQLKDIKQRKTDISKQEIQVIKQNKIIKQQLNQIKKDNQYLKQQLVTKIQQLKQFKSKRHSSDLQIMKSEIDIQKKEIQILVQENRKLKEQERNYIRKISNIEDDLAMKQIQLSQIIKKLNNRQIQLESSRTEIITADKTQFQLKQQLRKVLKQLDLFEEELNMKNIQLKDLANKKQLRQKQLLDIISKIQNKLDDKQRNLTQGQKFKALYQNSQLQKQKLQQKINLIQKKYSSDITEAMNTIQKLKEVISLNQIRANELKKLLNGEQKQKISKDEETQHLKLKIQQLNNQKKQLFKMIDEQEIKRKDDLRGCGEKIIQLEGLLAQKQIKVSDLQAALQYEKQYIKKYEEGTKIISEQRDIACKNTEKANEQIKKQKQKIKQLNTEVQKTKILRKQIEALTLQLQRVQANSNSYKRQIQQALSQKEQILKQMRVQMQKKQKQIDKLETKLQQQVSSLKIQLKDTQKKLGNKNKQFIQLRAQFQRNTAQTQHLKDAVEKAQKKLTFKDQEYQKQANQHQQTITELNNLRREYNKLKNDREQAENRIQNLLAQKRGLQQRVNDRKKEIQKLQSVIQQIKQQSENLRKETQLSKKQLQQSIWAVQETNKVNQQLTAANKQFALNQQNLTQKISQLQGKIFELQDQNRSYTPRYQSLIAKNKQLQQRNRELSDLINKAIQVQASAYKANILKQIQINSNQIIQQMNQEQEFKTKNRRNPPPIFNSTTPALSENNRQSQIKVQPKIQPYNRLVQQQINQHRKKVSESAQKLAGILQMNDSNGEQWPDLQKQEDYSKINNKMDSLDLQKKQFMQKISAFAQKLKIL